jgi:chaperone required for assembly of F1-ATPase
MPPEKLETPDERMRRLITGQFNKALPRRFYKSVQLSETNAILLDGKPVKTPLKASLQLPTKALGEAIAGEWLAQRDVIDPETMPLTKLANTAIDRATAEHRTIVDEITQYAGSDLVCYFAEGPTGLISRQQRHWQPVLDWTVATLDASFRKGAGISHVAQPPATLEATRQYVAQFDPWQLTAVYVLTTLTGSALLSLMLQAQAISPEAAWLAAHVDEDFQIEQWGEDEEAIRRRASRKREFDGLTGFLDLLKPA